MHRLGAVVVLLVTLGAGCRNALSSQSQGASEWEGEVSVPLLADRDRPVGTVRAWFQGGQLHVKYAVDAPWSLVETHLDVRDDWTELPQTKTHNPIPGHFTYKQHHAPPVREYEVLVDLNSLQGPQLRLAAHAELAGGSGGSAGAWAAGTRFTERGNWATWFTLDAQVKSVIAEGVDWQLMSDRGVLPDGRPYAQNLYLLQDETGISGAPLPQEIRDDLGGVVGPEETFLIVSHDVVEQIILAEKAGQLTPALAAIAEPQDSAYGTTAKCPPVPVTKSRSVNVVTPYQRNFALGDRFTGNFTAEGDLMMNASADLTMLKQRFALFKWCIPYASVFQSLRVAGSADVGQGATISGTVSGSTVAGIWEWEKEITTVKLGAIELFVGPIWVHIPLELPIKAGIDLDATLTGTLSYTSAQRASGSFNYTCTPACTGTASYQLPNQQLPDVLNAGISARLKPDLWVDVALKASLYWEKFLNAQLGVRPKLRGDLWGYYGNACGDANGDGVEEVVSALTADLDFQVFVTGQWQAFNKTPKGDDDLWHSRRYHLGFWDLLGSTAMTPMLAGPASTQVGVSTDYRARMRPCWPYEEEIDYRLAWGDGVEEDLSGEPATWIPASHAWSAAGTRRLDLLARHDAHGRILSRSTARDVEVQAAPTIPVPSAGLKLWLRADDGVVESGGRVPRWIDRSGNGNDAVMGVSARQPFFSPGALNGKPVVSFAGAQSLALTSLLQLPQATVFVVARNGRSDDQFNMILGPGGNSPNHQLRFENGSDVLLVTPDVFTANVGNTRTFLALSVRYDGTNWSVFRDGNIRANRTAASGTWALNQIAAFYSEHFMVGEIAEILAYDRPLSEAERGAVNNYLRTKYNLP